MKCSEFLLNLIYPPFCVACGELLHCDAPSDNALCDHCCEKWAEGRATACLDCHRREDECRCAPEALRKLGGETAHLLPYRNAEGVLEQVLLTAKRERYRHLFRFMGGELAKRADALQPMLSQNALITWLPRSRLAASDAGVDQAKELALAFAEVTSLECAPLFARIKGGAQKELTGSERLAHACAAYRLKRRRPPIEGRTLILIDDIFTTGSTMQAATELLREAGAGRIVCLTVAKTRSEKRKSIITK